MDKNFDRITLLVREKKLKKEENLMVSSFSYSLEKELSD